MTVFLGREEPKMQQETTKKQGLLRMENINTIAQLHTNDELEKVVLNFSKCTNRDVAPVRMISKQKNVLLFKIRIGHILSPCWVQAIIEPDPRNSATDG